MKNHFNKYHKVNHYSQQKQNAHQQSTYLGDTEQSELNAQLTIDNNCLECTDEVIKHISNRSFVTHRYMRFYVKIVFHPAMAIVKNIKYSKNDRTAEY